MVAPLRGIHDGLDVVSDMADWPEGRSTKSVGLKSPRPKGCLASSHCDGDEDEAQPMNPIAMLAPSTTNKMIERCITFTILYSGIHCDRF